MCLKREGPAPPSPVMIVREGRSRKSGNATLTVIVLVARLLVDTLQFLAAFQIFPLRKFAGRNEEVLRHITLIKKELSKSQPWSVVVGGRVNGRHVTVDDDSCILKRADLFILIEPVRDGWQVTVDSKVPERVFIGYGDRQCLGDNSL